MSDLRAPVADDCPDLDHALAVLSDPIESTTLKALGRGASAVVYRVRRGPTQYAVKVLLAAAGDPGQRLRAVQREAALLATIDHRGVAGVHDVGQVQGRPYLIMDFVAGQSLAELLRAGPLSAQRTVQIAVDLTAALTAAHRVGLVHRDVKPDNVIIQPDGSARLIDFGLAGVLGAHDRDETVGTLVYSSPEQAGMLNRPVDGRSDLYSLGAIIFECLTGSVPFSSPDPGEVLRLHATAPAPDVRQLRPDLTGRLPDIVAKLLAKDPDDRYQTGTGLHADLQRAGTEPDDGSFALATDDGVRDRTVGPPLVERDQELATLVQRWRRCQLGEGGAALIQGPPGVGKTRLVGEFANLVGAAPVLSATCSASDVLPMSPLRAAIEGYARSICALPEPDHTAAASAIRSAAGEAARLLAGIGPALASLLPDSDAVDDDRQDQFVVAVVDLLAALARQHGGLVLALDDVRWLDDTSLRVLRQLADQLARLPLFVLGTVGDDPAEPFRATLGTALDLQVVVRPLSEAGTASLIRSQLPGRTAPADLVTELTARARGNPFMVVEYLRAIRDAGLLWPCWDRWLLDSDGLDALALPRDALTLVLARLNELSERSRTLLTVAAVVGARFRPDLLSAACDVPAELVAEVMQDASARQLVRFHLHGKYAFVHDRIREALLADLDPARLREIHQRLAELLADEHSDDPEQIYTVARHYLDGEPDRSPGERLAACHAAGRLALAEYAPGDALGYLSRGAQCAAEAGVEPDWEYRYTLGLALHRCGKFAEAERSLTLALEAVREPNNRAMVTNLIAAVQVANADTASASATVRRGLAEFGCRLPKSPLLLVLSTILPFLAGLFVARTGIGFGTASDQQRTRYLRRLAFYSTAGYAAVLDQRAELTALFVMRSQYFINRVGPSPEYTRGQAGAAFVARMLRLQRSARRAFATAAREAERLGDPAIIAETAYLDAVSRYLTRLDDGETWLRVANERGRWLDVNDYRLAAYGLCGTALVLGDAVSARDWHERGLKRLAANRDPDDEEAANDVMLLALQDRPHEAAARLATLMATNDDTGQASRRFAGYVAAIQSAVERDDLGTDFETAIAQAKALKLNLRRLMPVHLPMLFLVYQAYGRLAQCAGKSGPERAARLSAAGAAVTELRRLADRPSLQVHLIVVQAELQRLSGDHPGALTHLAKLTEHRLQHVDSPLAAFEAARVRARALRALGQDRLVAREVSAARLIAAEQGWRHRSRWLTAEFGDSPSQGLAFASGGRTAHSNTGSGASHLDRLRLDAVHQVSMAAARVLDPRELVRVALDEAIRILGAERAFLFLVQPGQDELSPYAGRDASGNDLAELTAYSSTFVEAVRASGTALVSTEGEDGSTLGSQSVVVHGLRSVMAAPLQIEGRILGVVYLDSRVAKGIFTTEDNRILTAITNQVALSLETARAAQLEVSMATAVQQRDTAEMIRDALSRMSESLDPHEVLQRLARSVAGSLRSEQVMLLRQDGDGLTVATNAVADVDQTRRVAAESDPHLAQLARVAAPVTGTAAETKLDQLATAASWLALPLRIRHEQLGVLLVVSTEPDAFDEAGVGIGATLAAQGMIAYENALLYSKVSELATTDELTSIPNRRRFNELAEQTLARAHRTGSPLTALMLDIDHFKKINDTYGHPVGDEVIRAVSNRLRGHIRGAEVLGRYGGEEFVVLLETGDGFGPAERLRAAIADTPVETAAGHLVVTISIGGAELQASDHAVGTLLGRADLALYEAKRNGRNRVVMYREELAQTA